MEPEEELELLIFFTRAEVIVFYPKCPTKILFVEPQRVTNPKQLRILNSICKFLLKNNIDFQDYIDFVVDFYSKSKYHIFPPLTFFNTNKVRKLFLESQNNVESIRYLFKPTTKNYNGVIFDPDTKKYYGFEENKIMDAVQTDYRYNKVLEEGIKPFLSGLKPKVTKDLLYNTELSLASAINKRKVYADIIPNLFKFWKYAKNEPFYTIKTVPIKMERYQGEVEV